MIIRPCICIPVYNNPRTIRQVVLDCLKQTECPILVIDDGSETPVIDLFIGSPFAQALDAKRLELHRFPENRGKGAALQQGFQLAIEKNFTHLITMDADGQHFVSDVAKFLQAILQDPWAVVIGTRQLIAATVPKATKFGRGFSNFWVKYQTGLLIHDSQSGFRAYPLFHVQNMRFRTRHFDFEVEVLIRLLWKNAPVREVSIDAFYPSPHERISHFRKFRDNVRISLLNIFLVILSLLRNNREPSKAALALGLGVFVGCTPFFGFHTPMVLTLAFILRLNAPLLWIGTQVSLPFIAPILVIASVAIGRTMHGKDFSADWSQIDLGQAKASFGDWLIGSLILGLVLATLAATGTWIVCRKWEIKKQRPWTGKSRGGMAGNWLLKKFTRFFGIRAGYFSLLFIVPYFFLFSPEGRRASLEYWRLTRPRINGGKRALKVLQHFYRLGTVLLDKVYQDCFSTAKFHTESYGYENIYAALSSGNGAILLGAHVGAWEMAAKYLPVTGLEDRFLFVQYLAPGSKLKGREGKERRDDVLYVNEEENALMKIYSLLKDGKMICLLGDRPMDGHYELVPFFGKLAPFATTPFKIAALCRVPLVISFGFKKNRFVYHFMALPGEYYEYRQGRERTLQVLEWVGRYAQHLEKVLLDFPDQWFNFYPFWSSLPVLPGHSPAKRGRNCLVPAPTSSINTGGVEK